MEGKRGREGGEGGREGEKEGGRRNREGFEHLLLPSSSFFHILFLCSRPYPGSPDLPTLHPFFPSLVEVGGEE